LNPESNVSNGEVVEGTATAGAVLRIEGGASNVIAHGTWAVTG
jgi:hypothetical protein